MNFEDYVKQLESEGYIDENGKPLKCECDCTDFTDVNEYLCQFGREEYEVKCNDCGKIVGHWAFGYWVI